MADKYERIDCKCGHSYLTTSPVSNCPKCHKQNWSTGGGLMALFIVLLLLILVGFMFGALAWGIYIFYVGNTEKIKNLNWHHAGVLALAIISLIFFNDIFEYSEYPIMSWITYVTNTLAIGIIGFLFIKRRSLKK